MTSRIILDVSRYQPQIDFPLLYSKGQRHIIIKAGSGSLYADPKWESHYAGATAAGMIPDPYFWHDPIYDTFAQAKFFAKQAAGKRIGFVVLVEPLHHVPGINNAHDKIIHQDATMPFSMCPRVFQASYLGHSITGVVTLNSTHNAKFLFAISQFPSRVSGLKNLHPL